MPDNPGFYLLLWCLWILGSGWMLSQLGFFSGRSLRHAPPRISQFTLAQVVAVALLYFSLTTIVAITLTAAGLLPSPIASATAPASGPAALPPTRAMTLAIAQAGDGLVRLATVGVMLLLAARLVVGGWPALGLHPRQMFPGLALGLLAAFLLAPWMLLVQVAVGWISHALRPNGPPVHPILEAMKESPPWGAQAVLVLAAVVVAPLAEELFFRGLLQTALLRFGRPRFLRPEIPPHDLPDAVPLADASDAAITPRWRWTTILLASLAFAAVHYFAGGWEAVLVILPLAIALGYLYERTGNLFASITLHALFNATSTLLVLNGAQ